MKKLLSISSMADSLLTAAFTIVRCRTQLNLADYSGIFLVSTRATAAGSLFP